LIVLLGVVVVLGAGTTFLVDWNQKAGAAKGLVS
jgi:hypothetical protein